MIFCVYMLYTLVMEVTQGNNNNYFYIFSPWFTNVIWWMTHKPSINGIRSKNLHKFLVYLKQRSHIKKYLAGKIWCESERNIKKQKSKLFLWFRWEYNLCVRRLYYSRQIQVLCVKWYVEIPIYSTLQATSTVLFEYFDNYSII